MTETLPDAAVLHEAALRHLARYACSAASLTRVLDRLVERRARAADVAAEDQAAAREAVRQVVARLAASGAVDDAAFAAARAASLARAGRSRRAIAAHLLARGIPAGLARDAVPADGEQELAAALLLARRRRLGPFGIPPASDAVARRRALGVLARGGFAQELAQRVLGMDEAAAQAVLLRHRQQR